MLDKKIASLLNNQVNMEWYSAYFYLDIYSYYTDLNLNGFGNWFYVQTQEERDHAMLMLQYLLNSGEKVTLDTVQKPDKKLTKFEDPLHFGLEHERYVTSLINTIYSASNEAHDFRTMQFLDWFVKEQGEEEKNSEDLIKKYDLFGNDPKGLYMLDNELKTRVYAAPSLVL